MTMPTIQKRILAHRELAEHGLYPERDKEILRLHQQGMSYRQIGKRLGLTRGVVSSAITRFMSRQRRSLVTGGLPLSGLAISILQHEFRVDADHPLSIEKIATLDYEKMKSMPCLGKQTILEMAALLRQHNFELRGLPASLRRELDSFDLRCDAMGDGDEQEADIT